MQIPVPHSRKHPGPVPWSHPANAAEAVAIQKELRHRLVLHDDFGEVQTIAGIDVSYDIKRKLSLAFIVTMQPGSLTPIHSVRAAQPTAFPYIPGLLSFREIPVILDALAKLPEPPDLLMVDGQGIAHPRRMGIAAHLGGLVDIPSIGVAKSRLTGSYEEPEPAKGSWTPLMDKSERIGTVLRSRDHVRPLFISPGHRISQQSAVDFTLACLTRYRLPEPTRIADKLSKIKA